MDYKQLVEHLSEWNENLISELCADDILTCDDLCGCTGDCIVVQAITAITDLLARAESAESRAEKAERERDSVVQFLTSVIRHGTNPCECCKADCIDAGSDDAEYVSQCGMFEWSNPQNDMYGEGEE